MKQKHIFLLPFLFVAFFCKAQSYKFDFGPGATEKGYIQILPETAYTPEKGYGFEFSSNLTGKGHKGKDAIKDDYITSDKPFYFLLKCPKGPIM
ncbi:MAG TPA: hypothetical protein VF609_17175 [Flavisolibacter sp.]